MKKKRLFPFVFVLCLVAAGVFYTSHQSTPYDQPIDQQLWDNALTAFDNKQYDQVLVLASSADHPRFQTLEGLIWEHGLGVAKNPAKAFTLYHEAAKAGDPEAMNKISRFYSEGIAVKQDPKQAWKWTQKAAEKKDYSALFMIGYYHIKNKEREDHLVYANKKISAAAQMGSAAAFGALAFYYGAFQDYPQIDLVRFFFLHLSDSVQGKRGVFLLRERYPDLFFNIEKGFSSSSFPELHQLKKELDKKLTTQQKEQIKRLAENWKIGSGFEKEFKAMNLQY